MHVPPRLLTLSRLPLPSIRLPQIAHPVPQPRGTPRRHRGLPCLREQALRIRGEKPIEGAAGRREGEGGGGTEGAVWEDELRGLWEGRCEAVCGVWDCGVLWEGVSG